LIKSDTSETYQIVIPEKKLASAIKCIFKAKYRTRNALLSPKKSKFANACGTIEIKKTISQKAMATNSRFDLKFD
jgi:hypothetical protein